MLHKHAEESRRDNLYQGYPLMKLGEILLF